MNEGIESFDADSRFRDAGEDFLPQRSDTERAPPLEDENYMREIVELLHLNNAEMERMRKALLDPDGQLSRMAKNWDEKLEILRNEFKDEIGKLRDEITIDRVASNLHSDHLHKVELPFSVLVVDDNPDLCLVIASVLESAGIKTYQSNEPDEAITLLKDMSFPVDVALVDIRMPRNGKGLAATILADHPRVAVVLMSGTEGKAASEALDMGAHSFLEKPFRSNEELVLAVSRAAEYRRLKLSSSKR